MKNLYLSLLFVVVFYLPAQTQSLQGQWKAHVPFNKAYTLAEGENQLYCAQESGIMIYNLDTKVLKPITKVEGLSDVPVSTLGYSTNTKKIIVGYNNGNIDIIDEEGNVLNLTDIKRKNYIDKAIYNITTYENMAYLCTGFGLVVFDLEKNEFKDTYQFGDNGTTLRVNDVIIDNDTLFAATQYGVFSAWVKSPYLVDYQYWKRLDYLPFSDQNYSQIEKFNNNYFVSYRNPNTQYDEIIHFKNGTYTNWFQPNDSAIIDISVTQNYLCIGSKERLLIYNQNEQLFKEISNGNVTETIIKPDGTIYMSALSGFTYLQPNGQTKYLITDSPTWPEVSQVSTFDDRVWVSSGGPQNVYKHGAAYSYIDNKWKAYDQRQIQTSSSLGNTYKIAIDPRNPSHVYAGTYGYGIIEFLDESVKEVYEMGDLDIFANIPVGVGIRNMGIQFDTKNYLWMVLNLIPQPIYRVTPEGLWERPLIDGKSFNSADNNYSDLLVTRSGQVWVSTLKNGIIVFQDDGSGGYDYREFPVKNQDNEVLVKVFSLAEDNNGDVWVGTNSGPVIYYNPSRIFDVSDVSGYQVKIPRNDGTGNADYLLFSEAILDIAVDGANRKWLGTENSGAFLISDDGRETLLNFREENSPLLSNGVSGIGINHKSGQVYFATGYGLISYKGNATAGNEEFEDVYVYPNPVRQDYFGPITINGLLENTLVKITDISGNLVYETTSLGGQAIWDGKNFDNIRVATGVYMIMLSSEDGMKSFVTKVLFIH